MCLIDLESAVGAKSGQFDVLCWIILLFTNSVMLSNLTRPVLSLEIIDTLTGIKALTNNFAVNNTNLFRSSETYKVLSLETIVVS